MSRVYYRSSKARRRKAKGVPAFDWFKPRISSTRSTERAARSEENEDLSDVAFNVLDLLANDVEAHGLGEGTALADGHDITDADAEGGRAVDRDGSVALLKTVVLLDEVEVVAADDNRVLHLGGDDDAPKETSESV